MTMNVQTGAAAARDRWYVLAVLTVVYALNIADRFSISTLHVRQGTTVRFLVRNHDPIAHEFIVGDKQVHLRHQFGGKLLFQIILQMVQRLLAVEAAHGAVSRGLM